MSIKELHIALTLCYRDVPNLIAMLELMIVLIVATLVQHIPRHFLVTNVQTIINTYKKI